MGEWNALSTTLVVCQTTMIRFHRPAGVCRHVHPVLSLIHPTPWKFRSVYRCSDISSNKDLRYLTVCVLQATPYVSPLIDDMPLMNFLSFLDALAGPPCTTMSASGKPSNSKYFCTTFANFDSKSSKRRKISVP